MGSIDALYWGSTVSVTLLENSMEMFVIGPYDYFTGNFAFDGQFVEGNTYQLVLNSFSEDSDYYLETWQFDLTTSAIPVPAAVWLFGSGLFSLIVVARRKKNIKK